MNDGVDTLNFFGPSSATLPLAEPGTNTGISLTLGDKLANLLDKPRTDGWKEGVLKLNLRFSMAGRGVGVDAGLGDCLFGLVL